MGTCGLRLLETRLIVCLLVFYYLAQIKKQEAHLQQPPLSITFVQSCLAAHNCCTPQLPYPLPIHVVC
jgi:hypothetical protein